MLTTSMKLTWCTLWPGAKHLHPREEPQLTGEQMVDLPDQMSELCTKLTDKLMWKGLTTTNSPTSQLSLLQELLKVNMDLLCSS